MTHTPLGPNYARLLAASAISNLGDGVRLTALPLLAATLTRDPVLIAGLSFASLLPWFLFALISGALVDRWDRRLVMVSANSVRAVLVTLLAVAVVADVDGLPVLYAIAFLLGTAETLFDNAAQAILPSVIPRADLERANGRLYGVEIVTNEFAGPPLGGLLFAVAAAAPFFLDAVSFALSAALIATISGRFSTSRSTESRRRMREDIAEGVGWLWRHRLLRRLGIMLGLQNMLIMGEFSIFVLFALEILGLGEVGFGLLLASGTVGSVVATGVTPRLTTRIGSGSALVLAIVLAAGTSLGIALTSDPYVVAAMFALSGFTMVLWNVITVSLRQSIIPDRLLGRVNSVYRLLGWGTMPIGAALGGVLASNFGLRAPYFLSAGVLSLVAVWAFFTLGNRVLENARAAAEAET